MASETEGCGTEMKKEMSNINNIDGVVVRIENGPQILFIDLDGNASIGEIMKSPRLKFCDLYYGEFVIEGSKAPIKKIATKERNFLVVKAKYTKKSYHNNALLQSAVSIYDPSVKCKIGLLGHHKKWICHESDGKVVCNRGHCLEWEQFISIPVSKDCVALKSWRNQYVK